MRIYKPQPWGIAILTTKGEQTGAAVGLTLAQTLGRSLTLREVAALRWNGWIFA